ncbi:hypothetical protein [Melissospora conviva]|uniref:hypothetical protein n=1 Tax=Melissospora conviva TaxID=3388432 RepID=UPI003C272AE6
MASNDTPTIEVMRAHHERITRMLADPECVGELLLIGVALARHIDFNDPPATVEGSAPIKVIAEQVYGRKSVPDMLIGVGTLHDRGDSRPLRRLLDVFRLDRRRYVPEDTDRWGSVTCGRPMVRREGVCGRPASPSHIRQVTDPVSGGRQWLGACSQRACREWLADVCARNGAEGEVAPRPAANAGGVLERHLPEVDWWAVWERLDPLWSPPPEGRPFERPRLRLLSGVAEAGGVPVSVPVAGVRPSLTVLAGGWR